MQQQKFIQSNAKCPNPIIDLSRVIYVDTESNSTSYLIRFIMDTQDFTSPPIVWRYSIGGREDKEFMVDLKHIKQLLCVSKARLHALPDVVQEQKPYAKVFNTNSQTSLKSRSKPKASQLNNWMHNEDDDEQTIAESKAKK